MKIEHFAYQVEDATAAAGWYGEHLGFTIKRGVERPFPVFFLADSAGDVMIEIYSNPSVQTPEYRTMDPLILHLALVCETVSETAERLVSAGAERVSGPDHLPSGDTLAMLRDPWGLAIQLCRRAEPMI